LSGHERKQGLRALLAVVALTLSGSGAHALCDRPTAQQNYHRLAVMADVVMESLRVDSFFRDATAIVVVQRAIKGTEAGRRLTVISHYHSEMMQFPQPGTSFELRAVGGPEVYLTNACLYEEIPFFSGGGNWCAAEVCRMSSGQ
jgi:hypothetical protein